MCLDVSQKALVSAGYPHHQDEDKFQSVLVGFQFVPVAFQPASDLSTLTAALWITDSGTRCGESLITSCHSSQIALSPDASACLDEHCHIYCTVSETALPAPIKPLDNCSPSQQLN